MPAVRSSAIPLVRLMLSLMLADFRNVSRDGLLAFLILSPLLIALIFRFAVPDTASLLLALRSELSADLAPHRQELETLVSAMEPLLMSIFVSMGPG